MDVEPGTPVAKVRAGRRLQTLIDRAGDAAQLMGGEKLAHALLVIVPALFLLGFLSTGTWNYFDSTFPPDPGALSSAIHNSAQVWNSKEFLGFDNSLSGHLQLPTFYLVQGFYAIGGSPSHSQYLWLVSMLALGGIGVFHLGRVLGGEVWACAIAGLVYILNPWILDRLHFWLLFQGYCLLPFVLYITLRLAGAELRTLIWLVAALALLMALLLASPHVAAIYVVVATLGLLYYGLTHRIRNTAKVIVRLAGAALVTVILLAPFTLPALFRLLTAGAPGSLTSFSVSAGSLTERHATLLSSLSLENFHDPIKTGTYRAAVGIALGVGVFLLVSTAKHRLVIWIWIVALLGIALAAAPVLLPPTIAQLTYVLPWERVDSTYSSALTALGYSLIIALASGIFVGMNRPFRTAAMFAVVALLLAAASSPVVTRPSNRFGKVAYPNEYRQVSALLAVGDQTERTLLLPPDFTVKHTWAPYAVSGLDHFELTRAFFGPRLLEALPKPLYDTNQSITGAILQPWGEPLFRLTRTRFVLVRRDAATSFTSSSGETYLASPSGAAEMASLPYLTPVFQGQYLTLYEYTGWLPPRSYYPSNLTVAVGTGLSLQRILLANPQTDGLLWLEDAASAPDLSGTAHVVVVTSQLSGSATRSQARGEPAYSVELTSIPYDKEWQLPGSFRHLIGNLFANAWLIRGASPLSQEPSYLGESVSQLGLWIMLIGWVILIVLALKTQVRRHLANLL